MFGRPCSLFFISVLLCAALPALAGPNAGGVLIVHDAGLNPTCDEIVHNPVPACAAADNEMSLTSFCPTWKVYAAFPPDAQPRLKSLSWGVDWAVNTPYFYVHGGPSPYPQDVTVTGDPGWPYTPGTGATLTFAATQTGTVVELYCFVAYVYPYGEPVEPFTWHTTPHPSAPSVFVDDADPAQEDSIADFGFMGFGMPGYTPWPAAGAAPEEGGNEEQRQSSWGRVKEAYR